MKKASLLIIFITVVLSLPLTMLFYRSINILHWINILFACALVVTVIGSVMLLIHVGFFQGFIHNFKYFFKKISKTEEVVNQVERKELTPSISSINLPIRYPLLIAGGILVLFSTIISMILLI
ncbi:DUF3899 domain-containing protein [Ornithinibacillus sp. L9]|uniref:DUF3899 domain-containing protein n=1 Tax=Ornithinibacillus caprae TaxID=2678566 RepID=A0A6N8FEP3_9BACI|nr:DUF3899 domain-containing protein [Ornithinibacillus caprae]MUK87661.1 DUF3899 domain-containing protein [Ornithinibacillus caprae]